VKVSGLKGDYVAGPDAKTSGGAVGNGQENEELNWGRRHICEDDPVPPQKTREEHVQLVERVTALHDISPAPGLEPVPVKKRSQRDNREVRIRSCDDDAVRCMQARELSNRLENVTELLLGMINDLQYRVDDLEATRHGTTQPTDKTQSGERS